MHTQDIMQLNEQLRRGPVTSMELGYNLISPTGGVSLMRALMSHSKSLTSLGLYNNNIGDDGAKVMETHSQ